MVVHMLLQHLNICTDDSTTITQLKNKLAGGLRRRFDFDVDCTPNDLTTIAMVACALDPR